MDSKAREMIERTLAEEIVPGAVPANVWSEHDDAIAADTDKVTGAQLLEYFQQHASADADANDDDDEEDNEDDYSVAVVSDNEEDHRCASEMKQEDVSEAADVAISTKCEDRYAAGSFVCAAEGCDVSFQEANLEHDGDNKRPQDNAAVAVDSCRTTKKRRGNHTEPVPYYRCSDLMLDDLEQNVTCKVNIVQFLSRENNPLMVYKKYAYRITSRRVTVDEETVTYWRCRCDGCKARIVEKSGRLSVRAASKEHTCISTDGTIAALMLYAEQTYLAKTTSQKSSAIVADTTFNVGPTEHARLASELSTRTRIGKLRRSSKAPGAATMAEVVVPECLRTVNGERFLRYENCATANVNNSVGRMVIFCTDRNVDLLRNSEHLFFDGTFDHVNVKKHLFQQLWIVHARVDGQVMPLAFVYMTRKTTAAYTFALNIIFGGRTVKAKYATMDFDRAQMRAISQLFPTLVIKGCYFHLTQCVFRRARLLGLAKLLKNDDFNILIRMMPAMSNAEKSGIAELFDGYVNMVTSESGFASAALAKLLVYFRKNFVGFYDHNFQCVQKPTYPLSMWVYGAMYYKHCHPRTNCDVEALHSVLNNERRSKYTTLYDAMTQIKQQQKLMYSRLDSLKAGKTMKSTGSRKWERLRTATRNLIRMAKEKERAEGQPSCPLELVKNIAGASMVLCRTS